MLKMNHSTVWKIIYKRRRFYTHCQLGLASKSNIKAERMMLKDISKSLRISSQDLQVATIRTRWHKFDLHGNCAWRKTVLLRKNIRVKRKVSKEYLGKDQDFWNNMLWTHGSMMSCLIIVQEAMLGKPNNNRKASC